jgi:hypothetical protein
MIYLEGGGACTNDKFCNFSPANVNSSLAGDYSNVIGTALGTIPSRQEPGVYADATHKGAPSGIHDFNNPANPFRDWSHIYIPYCTGDLHFGTKLDAEVPDSTHQQFVGHYNMRRFIARIVPSYKNRIERVVLSGASTGAYGALLNYSMVQDAFRGTPVDLILDSGMFMSDDYMPACLQKRWRDQWGFDAALPPECDTCKGANGGNLVSLIDFVLTKHPNTRIAFLSSTQDEMIRLFYSTGLNDCADYDVADPIAITASQIIDPQALFSQQVFSDGLDDLRARYQERGRVATYYLGAPTPNLHQHIFRAAFFSELAGGATPAQFLTDFMAGHVEQFGP